MENNFNRQGIDRLPDPTSFQRRSTYSSSNPQSPQAPNLYKNKFSGDGQPFQSLDGRKWETRDQQMVANKEYYNKMGREINHKPENPEAFNLTNFYHFNKD